MDTMNIFGNDMSANKEVEKSIRRSNACSKLGQKLTKINRLGDTKLDEVNSKFSGKNILGEIYTPYNFRRWLPSQFMSFLFALKSMPCDDNLFSNHWYYRYHLEKIDNVCLQNVIDGKAPVRAASVLNVISSTPSLKDPYYEVKNAFRTGEPWKDLLDEFTTKVFTKLKKSSITIHDSVKDWYKVRYAIRKTLGESYVKLNNDCYVVQRKVVKDFAKIVLNELFTLARMEAVPDESFRVRATLFPKDIFTKAIIWHPEISLADKEYSSYREIANDLRKIMNKEHVKYSELEDTIRLSEQFELHFFRAGMYYTLKSAFYNEDQNPSEEKAEYNRKALEEVLQNGFDEKVILKYEKLLLEQDKFL